MKNKTSISPIIRRLVQLAALIFLPGLFITVFSAVGDVVRSLFAGTFSFAGLSGQLIVILAVFPITVLWGRFFCGYLCAFGTLGEFVYRLSEKVIPKKRTIPESVDTRLKYIKFGILAALVLAGWIFAVPIESSFSPWSAFGMLTSGNPSVALAALPTVGAFLLLLILIGSFLVERFFCRYLCPLGAIFSLVSGAANFKIRRNESSCVSCGHCDRYCPMGLAVSEAAPSVRSGECISCSECIPACPVESLSGSRNPTPAGSAAALSIIGLVSIGRLAVNETPVISASPNAGTNAATATAATASATLESGYRDGVYAGSGKGFRGAINVEVTVENGVISEISVVSSRDDAEFLSRAKTGVVAQILKSQSAAATPVSGATFSSNGMIEAVADALEESRSAGTQPAATAEIQPTQTPSTAPTVSAQETLSFAAGNFTDGVYTGSGTGFRGTIEAQVTVENGDISDITILASQDDAHFFDSAKSAVVDRILVNQTIDVQTVSGATFSSNGIIEAVADALDISYTNPNSGTGGGRGGRGRRR